jgi:3-dehydroquinate synthase
MNILFNLFPLLCLNRRYSLVTDTNVAKLYGNMIEHSLKKEGYDVSLIVFPAGEIHKTRRTKEFIEDVMLQLKMGRDTTVIALGGGVVSDLAGFVAATYCRGIPLINIPTTLMGMVDAAIGGKTGVNTTLGKNKIGAFYPASHILIEEKFLETLPEEEMKNGYAEVIKYALIASSVLFEQLEKGDQTHVVNTCVGLKEDIVKRDLLERGERRILNFGHTFAHAYEQVLDYRVSHGMAVAAGLLFESHLSRSLGTLSDTDFARIVSLLQGWQFPYIDCEALIEAMTTDKKTRGHETRFVILNGIGQVVPFDNEYCTAVDEKYVRDAYDYLFYQTI